MVVLGLTETVADHLEDATGWVRDIDFFHRHGGRHTKSSRQGVNPSWSVAPRDVRWGNDDVQENYRVVSSGFNAAVMAVTPDKWEVQSPCEEWTALDVVAHVVEGHRGVIASVRGGESEALGADEDPKQAWEDASRAIDEHRRPGGRGQRDGRTDGQDARR